MWVSSQTAYGGVHLKGQAGGAVCWCWGSAASARQEKIPEALP